MYETFYGFKEKPFDLAPNPHFLYRSKKHQNALAYLEYGLLQGSGLILLTGESGAGKTTIVRHLLSQIKENIEAGTIFTPHADSVEFLDLVSHEFALEPTDDKTKSLEAIFQYLVHKYSQGTRVLLVIDDAHNLSVQALEEIHTLSNLQTDDHRLLQIILAGQPELKRKLQSATPSQLSQRTAAYYHLGALERDETNQYIAFRLKKAGGFPDILKKNSLELIYRASGGIPKNINLLCDTALASGYAKSLGRRPTEVASCAPRSKENPILPEDEHSEDNQAPLPLEGAEMVATAQQQSDWQLAEFARNEPKANDRLVAELTASLRNEREKTDKLLLGYGRRNAGLALPVNPEHITGGSQTRSLGRTEATSSPLVAQVTAHGKNIADKNVQRVFVKEDNSAKIHCESCGLVRMVHMQDFASLAPVVRI